MEPLCSSTILPSLPGSEIQLAVAGEQLNQQEKWSSNICCCSKINSFRLIGKRLKLGHAVEQFFIRRGHGPDDAFTDTVCSGVTADVGRGRCAASEH